MSIRPAAACAMAPGHVSSSSCSSPLSRNTSPSGSSGLSGASQSGPNHSRVHGGQRNPPMLRMVLEALRAREQHQGTSVVAIKVYIQHKYPTVDANRFKYLLKQALDTGMRQGLLTRPANSKAKGATGSFKLVPKKQKKKRTGASTARRGAADTKGSGPKKPGEPRKDHASKAKMEKVPLKPGQRRKACPAATLEKEPKKASRAKLGEVREAPLKPDPAAQAPPTANRPGQKVKLNGSKRDAEAHGKAKDVGEKSRPSASQVQDSVTSLIKRKMAAMAHTEPVVQEARMIHKTSTLAPPHDMGHKAQSTCMVRKTKTPESPKRSGLPPKTTLSKASRKKTEASS